MPRQLLRSAAVSVLAAWAAGCANTPAPKASAAMPANGPKSPTSALRTAPVATAEASFQNLGTELQRAQTLRAQGHLAEATRVLAQLVLVASDDARVVGEYGKVLVQQGRSEDAVAFLKRATELNVSDWTLYSALGVAYDQMDDRKSAKAAYERALALHPRDAIILNNYAVSRMLAGDYDTARKLLLEAQARGANSPKVASNLEWLAQKRASKVAKPAIVLAPSSQTSTKPPRVIAAMPDVQPKITGADSPHSSIPKAKPVPSTPPKASDTTRVVSAGSGRATTEIPEPKRENTNVLIAPKHAPHTETSGPGGGEPHNIITQSSPADVALSASRRAAVVSSASPAGKAEKKVAIESLAGPAARNLTGASTHPQAVPEKATAAKPSKLAKAPPPSLRTADQGE